MTDKEKFISFVDELIEMVNLPEGGAYTDALSFFENFKKEKCKNSNGMTENGKKLLSWMQKNTDEMANVFTSKEAAEALFTSGRSIAGSMRKLVNDGFVEKTGQDPVRYSLTDAGKNYQFDN